jgi:hypothetical protein
MIRYIPNKAAKFGFKIYAVACSKSGYIYRFFFDMGKRTFIHKEAPNHLNKPGQVVWSLLRGNHENQDYSLFQKGHVLALDNWYTSPDLFYTLHLQKTDCLGTVRKNRAKLPQTVLKKKWTKDEKGSRILKYCYPLFLLNWMDNNPVVMMSSISSGKAIDDIVTLSKHSQRCIPKVVNDYNRIMPGIDLNDQMKAGRKTARGRRQKYYSVIFYHLLDIVLVNSFIYFKQIPKDGFSKTTHNDFRIMLAEQLVGKYGPGSNEIQSKNNHENELDLPELHLPNYVVTKGSCHQCSRTNNDRDKKYKQTNWICKGCDGLYFCQNKDRQCFTVYHEENRTLSKRIRMSIAAPN